MKCIAFLQRTSYCKMLEVQDINTFLSLAGFECVRCRAWTVIMDFLAYVSGHLYKVISKAMQSKTKRKCTTSMYNVRGAFKFDSSYMLHLMYHLVPGICYIWFLIYHFRR